MASNVWERIEATRERCNVLEHPFYQRWSAGELTEAELSKYSGQYRHAVVAIADLSDQIADELPDHPEVRAHAKEERDHIRLWDGFVDAVEGDSSDEANAETDECVEVWTNRDGALAALGRLYAIESGQPEISKTKLEGLAEHYGVESKEGVRYFTVHRGRDVEHAEEGKALLQELISSEEDEEVVVAAAEEAFKANWRLLDGI